MTHQNVTSLKALLNHQQIELTIRRLATQIMENNPASSDAVIIGLQPRGIHLSERIMKVVRSEMDQPYQYGILDITFYRDDVRKSVHLPNSTNIRFSIEGKKVILIDDVLFTGRTIRAALDALLDFGRPDKVELMVLIDRRYSRQLPIQPDYTGKSIDSIVTQKVKVCWQDRDGIDEVQLIDQDHG